MPGGVLGPSPGGVVYYQSLNRGKGRSVLPTPEAHSSKARESLVVCKEKSLEGNLKSKILSQSLYIDTSRCVQVLCCPCPFSDRQAPTFVRGFTGSRYLHMGKWS